MCSGAKLVDGVRLTKFFWISCVEEQGADEPEIFLLRCGR